MEEVKGGEQDSPKINKVKQLQEVIEALKKDLDISDKELLLVGRKIQEVAYTNLKSPDKKYLNYEMSSAGYSRILSEAGDNKNKITAQEALEYVAKEYGYDIDFINAVKNHSVYYNKKIVKVHDTDDVQKAMIRDGSMDRVALTSSTTPNQLLRKLSKQVEHHLLKEKTKEDKSKIKELEAKVRELEESQDASDFLQDKVDSHISEAKELLSLRGLPKKQFIQGLKDRGFTQSKVVQFTGYSLRTVKRNWKD